MAAAYFNEGILAQDFHGYPLLAEYCLKPVPMTTDGTESKALAAEQNYFCGFRFLIL